MSTINPFSAATVGSNARLDATKSQSAGSSLPPSHQRDRVEFGQTPAHIDGLQAAAASAATAAWGVAQRAGSTLGELAEHAAGTALPAVGEAAGTAFGAAAIVLTTQSPAGNAGEDAPNAAWRMMSPAASDRRAAAAAIHPGANEAQTWILPEHRRGDREGILTTPGTLARRPELTTFPGQGPQAVSTSTTPVHRAAQSTTVTPAHHPTAAEHVLLAERYDRAQAPTPKAVARAEAVAALPPSHRAVLESLKLPTGGEVPFRPPKNWDGRTETKAGRFPDWVEDAGYVKRNHINVSQTGKVTH